MKQRFAPSDRWLLTFIDNTTYEGAPIGQAFLKYWVSTKSASTLKTRALDYERWTYKHVIRKIVDSNICPNFVRYLTSAKNCTYNNIREIAEKSGTDPEIDEKLTRKILLKLLGIQRLEDNRQDLTDHVKTLGFTLLITEFRTSDSFHALMYRLSPTSIIPQRIWTLMFQVCAACYAMTLAGVAHNDLHSNNILCEKIKKPQIVTYIIEDQTYTFSITEVARVFDFDRSYVKRLQPNMLLEGELCESFGSCNTIVPTRDFVNFVGYVYRYYYNDDLLHMIAPKTEHRALFRQVYCQGTRMQRLDNTGKLEPLAESEYEHTNSLPDMLAFIYGKLTKTTELSDAGHVYNCSENMFEPDGTIRRPQSSKRENQLLTREKNTMGNKRLKTTP